MEGEKKEDMGMANNWESWWNLEQQTNKQGKQEDREVAKRDQGMSQRWDCGQIESQAQNDTTYYTRL